MGTVAGARERESCSREAFRLLAACLQGLLVCRLVLGSKRPEIDLLGAKRPENPGHIGVFLCP